MAVDDWFVTYFLLTWKFENFKPYFPEFNALSICSTSRQQHSVTGASGPLPLPLGRATVCGLRGYCTLLTRLVWVV